MSSATGSMASLMELYTSSRSWIGRKLHQPKAASAEKKLHQPNARCLYFLRHIADAPASCLSFYLSEKKLCRFVAKSTKGKEEIVRTRTFQRACILSQPAEKEAVQKKYKDLYIHPRSFILRIDGKVDGICPGCPQVP